MDGSPSFVWEHKLKRTKFALKAWIKTPLFTPTSSRKESIKELDFLSYIPSLVSAEINSGLIKPFSEQEVVEVIWGMEPDKAPRPDGVFNSLL